MKKIVVIMSLLIAAVFGGISLAGTPAVFGGLPSDTPAPLDLKQFGRLETATFALG